MQQLKAQFFEKGLYPPLNLPVTCSLVVLPLDTRTMWKPVRPKMGITKRDMMQMMMMETRTGTFKKLFKVLC